MSDIIIKAQRSSEITQTSSLSAWQRVWPALEALSRLTLSSLNTSAKEAVEIQLAAVNRITAAYDIEVEADYEKLTDSDALDILSRINAVTQLCIDSETDRVMQELDTAGRKLPVAAIKEVREHRDIFVPRLMRSLEQAIFRVRNGDEPEEDASFFAVFLLTELEVPEAFRILLEALRLPDEGPFELFGDGVHELVAPILALFSGGKTDEIGEIVQDSDVNMYVRWSAAKAYKYLVRDELISRQVAVDALHRHFQDCVENEDYNMLAPRACELGDLAAETSLETIRSAYQLELVDESIVGIAFIESQIASGEETVERELEYCRPTGIPDAIAELSRWAAFREEPPRPPRKPNPEPTRVPRPHLLSSDAGRSQVATTSIRAGHKVGRNDPCPCGSGKKFKKCCR
jgi:hypothetical protein